VEILLNISFIQTYEIRFVPYQIISIPLFFLCYVHDVFRL